MIMGDSRKYPYLYHEWLFGIPRARRGSLNWNSEGMGGSLNWNSEGMGGFQIWDFQRGQTRVCSLKTLILWTLQVHTRPVNKARTDDILMTAEAG